MNAIKTKKLFVFDLDGTLVDSFPLLLTAMQEVMAMHGLRMPADTVLRAELSKGLGAMFDCAQHSNPHVSPHDWQQLRAQHQACYASRHLLATPLFADVQQVLQSLHAQGLHMAVCTNRDRDTSQQLLDRWGLSQWLCALVTLDDMPKPKPAPDGLVALATAQRIPLDV